MAASGRIPYASSKRRRLDPIRIRQVRDGSLFEEMGAQLVQGLFHGQPNRKVEWVGLPTGINGKFFDFEMDRMVIFERVYDYNEESSPALLDFEFTVRSLERNAEYVAQKILYLTTLSCAPGRFVSELSKLRGKAAYTDFPALTEKPLFFLIFVSNSSKSLPEVGEICDFLKGKRGSLIGSDIALGCKRVPGVNNGLEVTAPNDTKVFVCLVGEEKLLELTYLARALDKSVRHDLVNERFLHDLTYAAGHPVLLQPMPRKVEVMGSSPPTMVRVDGKPVTFCRFSMDPFKFLRMGTVLRLVSDYAYLQRLPEPVHLLQMAHDIQDGGRFPTPILCIPPDNIIVSHKNSEICHAGGAIVTPYQWHIIDGQHRVFSYYFVEPGTENIQALDINSYGLANPTDKPGVASALFLNVNFKALKPPVDLALAHHAYASQWPMGNWVAKRKGSSTEGDSQLFSSRILASRFLLELSSRDTAFGGFFKARGAKDKGKTSIQSISTYLSKDFELRDPSDDSNPWARIFGTVRGATGIWTVPDPAPQALAGVWEKLVDSFDDFLGNVTDVSGYSSITGNEKLRELVSMNNNVFVGLWKAFYWYSVEKSTSPGKFREMPKTLSRELMPWLMSQKDSGFLAGKNNKFRSGAGAVAMERELVKLVGGP